MRLEEAAPIVAIRSGAGDDKGGNQGSGVVQLADFSFRGSLSIF